MLRCHIKTREWKATFFIFTTTALFSWEALKHVSPSFSWPSIHLPKANNSNSLNNQKLAFVRSVVSHDQVCLEHPDLHVWRVQMTSKFLSLKHRGCMWTPQLSKIVDQGKKTKLKPCHVGVSQLTTNLLSSYCKGHLYIDWWHDENESTMRTLE